jgi:hypothetical protein
MVLIGTNELDRMWREAVMSLFKVLSQNLSGGTEYYEKAQDSGCTGWDSNKASPQYKLEVLTA